MSYDDDDYGYSEVYMFEEIFKKFMIESGATFEGKRSDGGYFEVPDFDEFNYIYQDFTDMNLGFSLTVEAIYQNRYKTLEFRTKNIDVTTLENFAKFLRNLLRKLR